MKYQKKINKLSNDKINKLETLNYWEWGNKNKQIRKSFDEIYIELKKWIDTYNKIPTSTSKNIIEKKLGHFCSDKRKYMKKNKLTDKQIEKLELLKGWFWDGNK